jgi:hypothetical protein
MLIFKDIDDECLHDLARRLQFVKFSAGTSVVKTVSVELAVITCAWQRTPPVLEDGVCDPVGRKYMPINLQCYSRARMRTQFSSCTAAQFQHTWKGQRSTQ